MGNSPTKSEEKVDPANCRCQKTEFKLKWCSCGRSKPSNEPPTKIRFWIDPVKIKNGIPYNSLEIPEHAKTAKDRDPTYQEFVRGLQEYSDKINKRST